MVGSLLGGIVTDRLAARDIRWLTRFPGIGYLACAPLFIAAFGARSEAMMIAPLAAGYLLIMATLPGILNAIHTVCGGLRRATAFAMAYLFANLLGLSGGPLVTGIPSDAFAKSSGAAEGLRHAMMVVMMLFVPAGWFLLRAMRWLREDAEV